MGKLRLKVLPGKRKGIGEDMVETELIVPENHCLRPHLGAVIAGGHTQIAVRKKPKVAIIPTGTELVSPGEILKPGDIIEYNSVMLSGYVSEWGGEPFVMEKVADDYEKIKATIQEALTKADVVVINAGSSGVGRLHVFDSRRVGNFVHIAIKPESR